MKKISSGKAKERDITWFPQLVDKRKRCCPASNTCMYFIRTQYQDTSLLEYEELW